MPHQFVPAQDKAQSSAASEMQMAELETPETHDLRTAQAVNEWLAKVQEKARRRKVRFWTYYALASAFAIALAFRGPHLHGLPPNIVTIIMAPWLPLVAPITVALLAFLQKPNWNADELVQIGGVKAIGPLLELLLTPTMPRRRLPVYAALTRLLPQLKASDANLLSSRHRKTLYGILRYKTTQDYLRPAVSG